MAKITLRDYNREIEQLVEKGLTEEAIAHCKYILKSFPKHIDTYRLLGKTYLESQRYTEATDILKRVLSVVPDDFISQIGMSLIREDEGDLDGAIWHMERAFEVQPSNPAVQDELRRLYGRRDGVQPPKIRLTRGALVRMYARGELYQQAIAEIRAALSETPKRPDLECILARMYYLAGRKAECIETCSRLIAQLPYCYEANRILAEILPGTPQADAAEGYRQRVIALDPYASHVGPNAHTPAEVADSAVVLERFSYQPSQEGEQLPAWTSAVGVQWEDEPKADVPDWLSAVQQRSAQDQDLAEEEPGEGAMPVDGLVPDAAPTQAIPDWMSSVGWAPSNGPESPPEPIYLEEEDTGAGIAPAEVPEWLRNMAPIPEESEESSNQEDIQRLENLLPSIPVEAQADEGILPASETLPDWLSSMGEVAPEALAESPVESLEPTAEEALPDWLQGMGQAAPEALAESPVESLEPAAEEALPDWLTAAGAAENVVTGIEDHLTPALDESPIDAVIDEITKPTPAYRAESPVVDLEPPSPPVESELPDWLQGIGEEEPAPIDEPVEAVAELPTDEFAIDTPDELQTSIETILPVAEQTVSGELTPETLKETGEESILPAAEFTEPALSDQVGSTLPENIEAAVLIEESEVVRAPEAVEVAPAEAISADDMEAALAWLESLAVKQGADEETMLVPKDQRMDAPPEWVTKTEEPQAIEIDQSPETLLEAESPTAEFEVPVEQTDEISSPAFEEPSADITPVTSEIQPDWFQPETHIASEIESIEAETALIEETPALTPVVDEQPAAEQDMDSALAWLESLATRQGVDEDTLLVPKEQRLDTPPEWVFEETQETPDEVRLEAPIPTAEAEPDKTDLPVWLQNVTEEEFTPPPAVDAIEANAASADELPDWLQGIGEEVQAEQEFTPSAQLAPESSTTFDEAESVVESASVEPEPPIFTPTPDAEIPTVQESAVESSEAGHDPLERGQQAIRKGRMDEAVAEYSDLIDSGERLEEVIHDLREALYRFPVDISLWQSLGDAYARNNQLQEALDAYTKAEELLR